MLYSNHVPKDREAVITTIDMRHIGNLTIQFLYSNYNDFIKAETRL